jgi:hypothetical protein
LKVQSEATSSKLQLDQFETHAQNLIPPKFVAAVLTTFDETMRNFDKIKVAIIRPVRDLINACKNDSVTDKYGGNLQNLLEPEDGKIFDNILDKLGFSSLYRDLRIDLIRSIASKEDSLYGTNVREWKDKLNEDFETIFINKDKTSLTISDLEKTMLRIKNYYRDLTPLSKDVTRTSAELTQLSNTLKAELAKAESTHPEMKQTAYKVLNFITLMLDTVLRNFLMSLLKSLHEYFVVAHQIFYIRSFCNRIVDAMNKDIKSGNS